MREEKINGHTFSFYDNISELPISRFHAYSRYMLVASGVGDTLEDIDNHIGKIIRLLQVDVKKAHQELLNLRQNLFMVQNELDIRYKGFLFLTSSVNGEKWEDFSDAGIEKLYKMVWGEQVGRMNETMAGIVGAIDDGLSRYFPGFFADSGDKNMTELLRKRALLRVDEVVNGKDHKEELEQLDGDIFRYYTPKDFENDKAVVEYDKNFEEMCLFLSKEFGGEVKNRSVMEFYTAYKVLDEQNRKTKNKRRK